MNIVIVKQGMLVRPKCDPKVQGSDLGGQEVMTFAKAMSLHPRVNNVFVLTSMKSTVSDGWTNKVRPLLYQSNAQETLLNNTEETVFIFWTSPMAFFGGEAGTTAEITYKMLYEFRKHKTFLIGTDTRYIFQDLNEMLKARGIETQPEFDSKEYASNTVYMFQARNIETLKSIISTHKLPIVSTYKDIVHIPIHLLPMFSHNMEFSEETDSDFTFTSVDFKHLGRHRRSLLKSYLSSIQNSGSNCSVTLIGKNHDIYQTGSSNINGIDQMKYDQVKRFINRSKSQLVISELEYEMTNLIPNRLAEGVASNCVNFVHIGIDPKKQLFNDEILQDFLYVDVDTDIASRIDQLNNVEFRREICIRQREAFGTGATKQEMIKTIYNILKN